MRKEDLKYLTIDSIDDVITNVDAEDLPSQYALSMRGIRLGKKGMVAQRDFGTKQLYANVPTVPVTGSIVGGYRFYNKDNDTEYDVVITTDPTINYARIYVNDSTLASSNVGTVNNWIELTRVFTAQVNATPSTTTSTLVVKTVKDATGATYNGGVFNNNEVNYWICHNVTQSKTALILSGTGNTLATPNYMGSDGMAFAVNDYLVFFRTNWDYNNFYKTTGWSSPAAGTEINLNLGTTPHNRWLPVDAQKKVDLALGDSSNPPAMRNLQRIQLNAAKPLFNYNQNYLLTLPANWDAETIGGLCTYYSSKGTAGAPTIAAFANEIVTIHNDTNADGIAGSNFLQFNYSFTQAAIAGSTLVNLRMAVTLEFDGYQESDPVYRSYMQCPQDNVPSVTINTVSINPATMPKHLTAINFYATSHNNDISAADWVDADSDYVLYYSFPINSNQYNNLGVLTNYTSAGVNWSLYPTSQYCYVLTCAAIIGTGATYNVGTINPMAYTPSGAYNVGDILVLNGGSGDASVQVTNVATVPGVFGVEYLSVSLINNGTSGYATTFYFTTCHRGGSIIPQTSPASVVVAAINPIYATFTSTNGTLAGELAHATDKVRTLLKPPYLVKTARNQAAIHVVAQDDSTLRMSCYDGAGSHEDDNFPDVTVDANANKQIIFLNGRGVMQGLEISRDTVYVFRNTEAEAFDLQSGVQQIFDIDFLAKDSLVKSQYGITWAGRSGIYLMPESGASIRTINPLWQNKYDGSLMTDDGITPYITDSYRSAIISGYDPFTKSVWFHYQQTVKAGAGNTEYECARYYFESDKWSFRKLGGSITVKYFSQTTKVGGSGSANMLIGYSGGILRYPNIVGSYPYDDLETSAGGAGSGFETDLTINIRDLYSQVQNANLYCFLIECNGASITGAGNYVVEFFANQETDAFDTQYIAVDRVGEFVNIDARGDIDSLRIRISLPTSALSDFKKMDISRIVLGFKTNGRIGNI